MRYANLVALLLLPLPALAQDAAPEIRQFDIATIEKLGRDIYAQDQVAWHATDALMALHSDAEMRREKVRIWIVEQGPEGQRVRFIREGENGPEAAYDIDGAPDTPHVSVPQDRALTDAEKGQFQARLQAMTHIARSCSDRYNSVALPDPEGDGWLVWALAATTKPKTWFVGGNYRFTVSKDGNTIMRTDALSRGCLTMAEPAQQAGRQVAAQVSSQLVSSIPVETAVFVNLQSGLPMYVATPDRSLWAIEKGVMHKVDLPSRQPQ